MSTLQPIQFSADDGVDRKQLLLLRRRLAQLNRERLEHLRHAARDRERLVVDVLPLLFHVNHPALPGWVSVDTPAAIADYTPTQTALRTAKKIARTFEYERRASLKRPLHGLFLMGSTGTIAHSTDSDLDLWLVLSDDVSDQARALLDQKIQRISQFARELNCRLHCFPMTAREFRERRHGSLSGEHAGSTQHRLLLDEFYRTAIGLAGRLPLWWMVPPEQHQHYDEFTALLLSKRYIRHNDFIDFGNVETIPVNEFFSGAVWHLYKAIDSPYKSVLKLVLMEAYANAEPPLAPLSLRFKEKVYRGDVTREQCDPYLMVLRAAEDYLRRGGWTSRLQLLRRCFYIKVGEKLSFTAADSWRRNVLKALIAEWGWPQSEISDLDNRRFWKVARTQHERRLLINELTASYRALFNYARDRGELTPINRDDLTVLGRKLYAAFEKRVGKIEQINPGIAPDISEPALAIQIADDGLRYALYQGAQPSEAQHASWPLRYAHDPLELIVWAQVNGICTRKTQWRLSRAKDEWRQHELLAIARATQQFLAPPLPEVLHDDLLHNAHLKRAALFLNMGVDPFAERARQGVHLVSSRTDPLAYGAQRENLLLNIGLLRLNSWGEVEVNVFHSENALAEVLSLLLKSRGDEGLAPPIEVHCFSATRADSLIKRVTAIVDLVVGKIRRLARATAQHYILRRGFSYWQFTVDGQHIAWQSLHDFSALMRELSKPLAAAVERHFDEQAFDDSPLALIYRQRRQGAVQVFFRVELDRVDVWVLDEVDALVVAQQAFSDWSSLIQHWALFLRRIGERLDTLLGCAHAPAEFYELPTSRGDSEAGLRRLPVPAESASTSYFGVSASIELHDEIITDAVLICGEQEFSELESGEAFFRAAAKAIFQQRARHERYPIYIDDLVISATQDISHCAPYVRYKLSMEEKLNAAI